MVDDAVTLEQLEAAANEPGGVERWLAPPDTAVIDWARADLDAQQARWVRYGRTIALPASEAERMRAYGPDGAFLALLRRAGELWKPDKVFEWNE